MALSPMMTQYREIKDKNRDCIVFYRLGDFYEMFFEDAIVASKELELTLTGRDCGLEQRAPMCGVPFHSCDNYINRLISKGYKVAICEQTEDPPTAKDLVKRDIIRVITPGTVTDTNYLDETRNNYICAFYRNDTKAAAVFADITTGDINCVELGDDTDITMLNVLGRYSPSEILCCEKADGKFVSFIKEKLQCAITVKPKSYFDESDAAAQIRSHFAVSDICSLGLRDGQAQLNALGALLCYLHETQFSELEHVKKINIVTSNTFLELDLTARRNLELCETMREKKKQGSLLGVIDKTKTAMGSRTLRSWIEQPLIDVNAINERLDSVEQLKNNFAARANLAEELDKVYDIERLMTRLIYNSAGGRDLLALMKTLSAVAPIKESLSVFDAKAIRELAAMLDPMEDITSLIDSAINPECPFTVREGNLIKKGYNSDVDELRAILNDSRTVIAEIERDEREKTGIRTLKIGYNKVFGYYIEVSKSFTEQVPEHYIRKQTLVNGERYITQELKDIESKILGASERITRLEYEIFNSIRQYISSKIDMIQKNANALSQIDVLCSLAAVAEKNSYVKPAVNNGAVINIKNGRHPVVEKMISDGMFIANDTCLDNGNDRLLIITGPNMAGKSTYMRQVAIITLMAQIGSFVPAESAEIGVVDRIFTRIGASDDLTAGQSTFMLEMNEVANILKNATEKSLIIYDEIGRGTSTFDGMSIARAVLEHTADKIRAKTLFATHYHELSALENKVDGVKNYQIAVKKRGDDIIFLRKIIRGQADDSYGIEVAKLAGIPEAVIDNAKGILKTLEMAPKAKTADSNRFEREYEQLTLASSVPNEIFEKIRNIDVDVLSPIEALNILYGLVKEAKS